MSPTVTECLEHARQCEWYAARTNDEEDRKFLLRKAKYWTKLAAEKELEVRASARATPASVTILDILGGYDALEKGCGEHKAPPMVLPSGGFLQDRAPLSQMPMNGSIGSTRRKN